MKEERYEKVFDKRNIFIFLVLFVVSILCVVLLNIFGKDPTEVIARRTSPLSTLEDVIRARGQLDLNEHALNRYFHWVRGIFIGDIGISLTTFNPVFEDISVFLPNSTELVYMTCFWIILLALPISLLCARFANGLFNNIVRITTLLGLCIPTFWLGLMFLLQFAVRSKVFSMVAMPDL